MKKLVRGIVALVTVILSIMLASGAQAATPGQTNSANYISSMRNAAGLPSLSPNEQMNVAAQAWADHLAAADNLNLSTDPNIYKPSGTTNGTSVVAYYSRNDPQAAMDSGWGTNANNKSIINTPSWNTIGTGIAVSKSGAVYLVADMVHVNPPAVVAAPLPAPVPAPVIAAPAPVVIPQPAPDKAVPVEQAPAQAAPAPPAPATPEAPAPEAPKETAKPSATASATATATPSATATASATAIAEPQGKNMDALRTSEHNSPFDLSKESQQALGFGIGGPLFLSGGFMWIRNRPRKETSN